MISIYSLVLVSVLASVCSAGPTIIISGPTSSNSAKIEFASQFISDDALEDLTKVNAETFIFNRQMDILTFSGENCIETNDSSMKKNVSTVALIKVSIDELKADSLMVLENLLRTERSLFVIDFSENLSKNSIWSQHAKCYETSRARSEKRNTVYLCNKKADTIPFDITTERMPIEKPSLPIAGPSIFAAAASKDEKKNVKEDSDSEEEVEKRADSSEEDEDDKGNEFDNKHDPKRDHRLHCKYRKSCYATGKRGLIEPYDFSLYHIFHFWRAPPSQQHHKD